MNKIENIIAKRKQEQQDAKKTVRPVLNISKEDFDRLFDIEAQFYIDWHEENRRFDRNETYVKVRINGHEYKNISVDQLIKELYLYATASENTKLSLRKGLLFSGNYGTGKTLILTSFVSVFNNIFEKQINKVHATDVKDKIIQGYYESSLVKRRLYIEDVGREHTFNHYGTIYYPVTKLIDDRYRQRTWTFACTNFAPKELRENIYQGYIYDRMRSLMNFIEVESQTKRK